MKLAGPLGTSMAWFVIFTLALAAVALMAMYGY